MNYKKIILLLFLFSFLVSCMNTEDKLIKIVEMAYFEGQKDAINGDIRIKMTSDSVYIWTKSCWSDGRVPIYNPTYLDSKKKNN